MWLVSSSLVIRVIGVTSNAIDMVLSTFLAFEFVPPFQLLPLSRRRFACCIGALPRFACLMRARKIVGGGVQENESKR